MQTLTISDIARVTGKSRTTIYRYIRARGVPHADGQPIAVALLVHHKIVTDAQLAAWEARQVPRLPSQREMVQALYLQTPTVLARLGTIETMLHQIQRVMDRMVPPPS